MFSRDISTTQASNNENQGSNFLFALDDDFMVSTFPNGIRYASVIDQNKLRRAYAANCGDELPENMDLSSLLRSIGICHKEKAYFFTNQQKKRLKGAIESLFAAGHHALYYTRLFALQSDLLEDCHLYDAEALRIALMKLTPDAVCEELRVLASPDSNDLTEIQSAFGNEIKLNYAQIQEHCPYLDPAAIKAALSSSDSFVWTAPETYAQTDLIELSEHDVEKVKRAILPKMQEDGYFPLNRLPIEESCERNPDISRTAVRDAMYLRYMSSVCSRRGVIATPKGSALSSYDLMKRHCLSLDRATMQELSQYEYELTGSRHFIIRVACGCMVRTDADSFVSDERIAFDIKATDEALRLFVGEKIAPITEITSFTSFPDVKGYPWNLYLLESFLRRFSRKYRLEGGPAQSGYVGGIHPRFTSFDSYEDMLAAAVIQDSVPLDEDAIGRYLTDRKYILRRSRKVKTVFRKALKLYELRGMDGVRLRP